MCAPDEYIISIHIYVSIDMYICMYTKICIYIYIYQWTHWHGYEKPTRLAGAPVCSPSWKSFVSSLKSTSASCLGSTGRAGDSAST